MAVFAGDQDIVALLVQHGADVAAKDVHGREPLHYAAQLDSKKMVELLIELGAKREVKDVFGKKPIDYARESNHHAHAKLLRALPLKGKKAKKDAKSVKYVSAQLDTKNLSFVELCLGAIVHGAAEHINKAKDPIWGPVEKNDFDALHKHIERASDPAHIAYLSKFHKRDCRQEEQKKLREEINTRDHTHDTPLHKAVKSCSEKIINELILAGAEISAQAKDGQTPLHRAVRAGTKDAVRLLIKNGAALDVVDRESNTPLHIAVIRGNIDIVKILLRNKARSDIANKNSHMPVDLAIQKGNLAMVEKFFKSARCSLDHLHAAALCGHTDIMQHIVSKGVAINSCNSRGDSILHIVVSKGHDKSLSPLIDLGANIDAANKDGETPLHCAVKREDIKCVESLLELGADSSIRDNKNNTALYYTIFNKRSSEGNHIGCLELFIRAGADINKIDPFIKGTLLHLAVEKQDLNAFFILTKFKADINSKNENNQTPLDIADQAKSNSIKDLLEKRGAQRTGIWESMMNSIGKIGSGLNVNIFKI